MIMIKSQGYGRKWKKGLGRPKSPPVAIVPKEMRLSANVNGTKKVGSGTVGLVRVFPAALPEAGA